MPGFTLHGHHENTSSSMEVDQEDKVMPNAGHTEGNEAGVVVPKDDGADYLKVKERQGLAQLPVAPVNGAAEGTAEADTLMEEVEDVKAQQQNDDDDDDEEAGDDDDLFGCVSLHTATSQTPSRDFRS